MATRIPVPKLGQSEETVTIASWRVKEGDKIKKGQLLLTMDLDKIKAAGHPAVVITVITNTDEFADVDVVASGEVEPGADMIKVTK